tara:strand:- start:3266 stop:4885 length:1620 start_codon:yes stop_codon:yes gene_type:complete
MNKVIYTAIIGGYDELIEPDFKPDGWDFVCFTNRDLKSNTWEIRKTLPLYGDNTRTARKHKLLAHRLFPDYDYSLWIDGNIKVRDDVNELLSHLDDCNYATYNHLQNTLDPRDCIYEEAFTILELGIKNGGNYKDDPELIKRQMERYVEEGFPKNNGLVVQMEVLRRHNEDDVVYSMEKQWIELKHNSKREQLSFNYIAWKNNLKFNYIQGDSRNNKYFLNIGKHKSKVKDKIDAEPIHMDYFLNMELANGGGGKEVINQNGKLRTVGDVVEFWKNHHAENISPHNWQYYNCMRAGFKKNVGDHHKLGWEQMTKEYYDSLDDMTYAEIVIFLKNNPVDFDNGYIRHSYHRACAMIGRLISEEEYVPFYMHRDRIFDKPRDKDGIHRISPLIDNVKYLDMVKKLKIPVGEFTICQSGLLAVMAIRQNEDLDIIISTEARNQLFQGNKNFMRHGKVEIFESNKTKFMYFNAQGDDDLIENYSFQVGGYNFLEPRFYLSRKRLDREKDKKDWKQIQNFFDTRGHEAYPFNKLTTEQWAYDKK